MLQKPTIYGQVAWYRVIVHSVKMVILGDICIESEKMHYTYVPIANI